MLVVRRAVVGPFAMNAWLVACDRTHEAALIDPGDYELPRVLELLAPEGFRVVRIVLTHGHLDHVTCAAEAAAATGAPVQIHAEDQFLLDALPAQTALFGLPPPRSPPAVAHHVHGERFRVGDHEATVLHVPGHSPGSCAIHFAADGHLFSGDTLFAGGVGRVDLLPGGDARAIVRSIREVLFALGDETVVHCGHGPDTTIGIERRENPYVGEAARAS